MSTYNVYIQRDAGHGTIDFISSPMELRIPMPALFSSMGFGGQCLIRSSDTATVFLLAGVDQARCVLYSTPEKRGSVFVCDLEDETIFVFDLDTHRCLEYYDKKLNWGLKCDTVRDQFVYNSLRLCEPVLFYDAERGRVGTRFGAVSWFGRTTRNIMVHGAAINVCSLIHFTLRAFTKFDMKESNCSNYIDIEFRRLRNIEWSNLHMLIPNKFHRKGAHPELVRAVYEPISNTHLFHLNAELKNGMYVFSSKVLAHLCSLATYVPKTKVHSTILSQIKAFPRTIFLPNVGWSEAVEALTQPNTKWLDYKTVLEKWSASKLDFVNLVPIRICD